MARDGVMECGMMRSLAPSWMSGLEQERRPGTVWDGRAFVYAELSSETLEVA